MTKPRPINFPSELPITAHVDEILKALKTRQTIIVSGDTGSGKTTQLPKIALLAGRGERGIIGCTQPRRLAAMAMARRVAEEFGQEPGGRVGFQHRFDKKLSRETRVKFMTDGILLAETRRDRLFRAYDTLIIDEAHERSLNIDFLLGILKQTLPRRPELKLIISSATLDVERFAAFFDNAPVISVPGRLYPIETRWRPLENGDESDLPRQIANACDELIAEGPGDILVFLSGERDIRDTGEVLAGRRLPQTEIIPLLASLPAGEQQRAFKLSSNRRIILATNVAETSITLPGIRYVVDSGLARLKRYTPRTRVQRLRIEPVSQASARQRQGRCGRVAPGICVRLYSEEDFRRRDHFTPPEILRSKLSGVILTMLEHKLGDIEAFPFIDPPSGALIREGYRELHILGALGAAPESAPARLSGIGRQLARLPLDPALARVLLAAHHENALADALTVVAALECDDPRRRPLEKQAEADKCHARHLAATSDFAALLRLWRWYHDEHGAKSQAALRRICRDNFISYPRMRDWQDLRAQLERLCRELSLDTASSRGGESGLHRALLAGLLMNIGKRDPEGGDYRGAHGLHFAIFPGSGLVKARERQQEERRQSASTTAKASSEAILPKSKEWILAAELVETSRLFARTVACIEPAWIEPIAKPHCKYHHYAPEWDGVRGFVSVKERATLFGLPLAESRRRDYSRINPVEARDIFIREGLVAGVFPVPVPRFLEENLALCAVLLETEAKTRRHGAYLDTEALVRFYAERLPQDICSAAALRRWLKAAGDVSARELQLTLTAAHLPPPPDLAREFPDSIVLGGNRLALTYSNTPGAAEDGVTCTLPAELLPLAASWRSDWLVPGMLEEKIRWLLGMLPSRDRRLLQPLDDTLAMCLTRLRPGHAPLAQALAEILYGSRALRVDSALWREDKLPDHLRMRFRVVDANGRELGQGRNLAPLLKLFGAASADSARRSGHSDRWRRDNLVRWDFGALPAHVDVGRAGWPVLNYPALVDKGDSVSLRLYVDPDKAAASHAQGVVRLFALVLGSEGRRCLQPPALPRSAALYLRQVEMDAASLGRDIGCAALHETFVEGRPPVREATVFKERLEEGRGRLYNIHLTRKRLVVALLEQAAEIESLLLNSSLPAATSADLMEQLAWLVFPGFARTLDSERLQQLPRYLEACRMRIQRAQGNPQGEARKLAELLPLWQRYLQFASAPTRHDPLALSNYRWQIEELRVSLFAQELRTPAPVSTKRLNALWDAVLK